MPGAARAGAARLVLLAGILLVKGLAPAPAQDSPMNPGIAPSAVPRVQPQPRATQPAAPAPRRTAPAAPSPPRGEPTPAEVEARRLGPPPPYEKSLVELSEAIGSLAFLSGLCGPPIDPNPWQRRMEGLLDAEGEVTATRERMMGAYNLGFGTFQTTYRQCTDAARAARSLLVKDAARIAREIERRYGS